MKTKYATQATVSEIDWRMIQPNEYGDWVSQRSVDFEKWPVIGDKKKSSSEVRFFESYSRGAESGRDYWVYSYGKEQLIANLSVFWETFDLATKLLEEEKPKEFLEKHPELTDPSKISWTATLETRLSRKQRIEADDSKVTMSIYRPFSKTNLMWSSPLIHRMGQMPSMFPTPEHRNIGFYIVNPGSAKPFSTLATDLIPDLAMWGSNAGQFFPRFTWEKVEASDGELDFAAGGVGKPAEASAYGEVGEVVAGYRRVDNATDEIKKLYRDALGGDISGDDIFHFVYGKLHDPEYREKYAADLKKMLPHIETPATREEFDKFAVAGEKLMALHVGYEDVEPYPVSVEVKAGADPEDRETWRVLKMKWKKVRDPETGKLVNDYSRIECNKKVTIANLPVDAEEYLLGSRSALAWIIDRYQVKKDKASGIVNDPNDWADEVGNPRYIVDLIAKVARVAVETNDIVKGLS